MSAEPLAGHLSVDESARRIRHYRYVEERMMRILGGWIALTPELPAKLLFGRHVWDCAQHADLWGRRLPELRAPAQQSEPANHAVVRLFDLLEEAGRPQDTLRRVAAMYRVVKPHLAAVYEHHLAATNPIYEPPTRRILERSLAEERRHVASGVVVFDRLRRDIPGVDVAAEWQGEVLAALAEAGGVTGDDSAPRRIAIPSAVDPATVAQDLVATPPPFDTRALPADLAGIVSAHAKALEAGHELDAARHLDDSASALVLAEYRRLGGRWTTARVVALASIGHAYHVVKIALERPDRSAVLQLRWKRFDATWRVVAADVVRDESRV
jgi:hypothetical protein